MRLELGEHANSAGIYKITCLVNGWFYIGQAVRFSRRAREHSSGEPKRTNKALASAMKEYGKDAFVMHVVAVIADPEARTREELRLIREAFGPGCYNATRRRSPENQGRRLSRAHCEKIRAANLGRKHSRESVEKQRAALRGRKLSPEQCEKIRAAKLGMKRTFSPEHCANLRAAKLAYWARQRDRLALAAVVDAA